VLKKYLTINTVVEQTGLSHWTVRHWLKSGRLASIKPGRRRLILEEDVIRLLAGVERGHEGER
jgi:excisionase family DNA binding protein